MPIDDTPIPFDDDHAITYQGRLDACPWCHVRPSVLVTPPHRRRVECVNPRCPVNPMSCSFDTPEEAADSWNYLPKGTRR